MLSKEEITITPIERFKSVTWNGSKGASDLIGTRSIAQVFLSSGTSQGRRAQSPFSSAGLERYRQAALEDFVSALPAPARDLPLHSFIPAWDPDQKDHPEWAQSSLSYMLGVFSERFSFSFVRPNPASLALTSKEPAIYFGTARQWQTVLNMDWQPHPGSYVFETGGMKGFSEEIDKAIWFKMLSRGLKVPLSQIFSEYGMAELSCQAYGRWVDGQVLFNMNRQNKLKVTDVNGTLHDQGKGLLTILDHNRIDLKNKWIRTQDIVELYGDQQFEFIERSQFAPLKGCSLTAQTRPLEGASLGGKLVASSQSWQNTKQNSRRTYLKEGFFHAFLNNPEVQTAFAKEYLPPQKKDLVPLFFQYFRQSLPVGHTEPLVAKARGGNRWLAERWLFIPPSTHSFALVYPLLVGALCGLKVSLRMSKSPFLELWRRFLEENLSFTVELVDPGLHFRDATDLQSQGKEWDAILLYGSDDTVESLRDCANEAGIYLKGFGSEVSALDLAHGSAVSTPELDLALHLFFHRGCLCPRLMWNLPDGLKLPTSQIHPGFAWIFEQERWKTEYGLDLSSRLHNHQGWGLVQMNKDEYLKKEIEMAAPGLIGVLDQPVTKAGHHVYRTTDWGEMICPKMDGSWLGEALFG